MHVNAKLFHRVSPTAFAKASRAYRAMSSGFDIEYLSTTLRKIEPISSSRMTSDDPVPRFEQRRLRAACHGNSLWVILLRTVPL